MNSSQKPKSHSNKFPGDQLRTRSEGRGRCPHRPFCPHTNHARHKIHVPAKHANGAKQISECSSGRQSAGDCRGRAVLAAIALAKAAALNGLSGSPLRFNGPKTQFVPTFRSGSFSNRESSAPFALKNSASPFRGLSCFSRAKNAKLIRANVRLLTLLGR